MGEIENSDKIGKHFFLLEFLINLKKNQVNALKNAGIFGMS